MKNQYFGDINDYRKYGLIRILSDGKKYAFTIVEIKGDDIYMDGNHPWAGKTLHYSVEVMEIRDATTEELEHGHVHGEGGHHH